MVFSCVMEAVGVCGSCSLRPSHCSRILTVTTPADNSPASSVCSTRHRAVSSQAWSGPETLASAPSAFPALRGCLKSLHGFLQRYPHAMVIVDFRELRTIVTSSEAALHQLKTLMSGLFKQPLRGRMPYSPYDLPTGLSRLPRTV